MPESCACGREAMCEALTGLQIGQVLSPVIKQFQDADALGGCGRPQPVVRFGKSCWYPAGSKTLSMFAFNNLRENREIPRLTRSAMPLARVGKSKDVRQ